MIEEEEEAPTEAEDTSPAAPLNNLVRRIRHPATYREIIASCLRSVYMGDPFSTECGALPPPPRELMDGVRVDELMVGQIRCAKYVPVHSTQDKLPLVLYIHGGGFVVGCSEDTDYITRSISYSTPAIVLSINYRLSPESIFPAALDDCDAVHQFAKQNAGSLGINSEQIFLAGDSAGGNLAAALSQRLLREIAGQVLLAPWLDMHVESYESYNRLAPDGIVFDAPFIGYARAAYTHYREWTNPLVSPIYCMPSSMPPTLVIAGSGDPLYDQSIKLQEHAKTSTHIEVLTYPGMPHCFYSLPNLFDEERDCHENIATFIRKQCST